MHTGIQHAGQVKWRLEYRHVASPVARLLLAQAGTNGSPFALFGKVGSSPRVYATQNRDALLKSLQSAAYKKMGLTLAGLDSLVVSSALEFAQGAHKRGQSCTAPSLSAYPLYAGSWTGLCMLLNTTLVAMTTYAVKPAFSLDLSPLQLLLLTLMLA